MAHNSFDPYQANRLWSPTLSPGLGTDMPLLNMVAAMLARQGIFPQPQGTNSVMDMMMLRSRNVDQHYIMRRAFASSQLAARMGGINMDSPFYQALYPLAAMPESPVWKMMSPLIGGNPVRAQMGLYADLNGQTLASLGRLGSTTSLETDRMMDQLQGRFYRRADFGKYVNSTSAALRSAFGDNGFEQLNQNWSMDTIRGLEGLGRTRVNRDVGNLLERSINRIGFVRDSNMTESEKNTKIEEIRKEAKTAAESFLSSVSSREAQQKMGKSFADALNSENAKDALKEFKNEWKADVQDAFRIAERGVDFKTGRVPGSIDYRFTRGFNIEDITGAFTGAADANLMGRNAGLNIGQFAGSATGALDAARGLFGRDLSGRELTDEMSKLLGVATVNLSNEGDARKFEEMLRNVKAMARVAGVSIESMKGAIDEAKLLAAQTGNLPIGLGGFAASDIAIKAMGDTTAAMSYMDPAMVRALGGARGINSSRLAALTQGHAEPTSRILGALHYHAVQVGGKDSAAAKAIREFAQTGDTTSLGLNSFVQKIAPSLNMTPYHAMNFAQTNPLLANLGLEQAPEIGRAGLSAMKTTLLREWDAYTGGTAGFGRELLNVGLNSRYQAMTPDQLFADVQSRLGRPLTDTQKSKLLKVLNRSAEKNRNNEGLMGLADIMAVAGIQDPRGTGAHMIQGGFDIEFAQEFNLQARAAHRQVTDSRKSSARLEAFHAANLAEINAPLLQRLFQAGLDGRLEAGGADELRRIFSGAPDATAYGTAISNLKEAERLYAALPEGKLDEAGNLIGGASDRQIAEVLRKLYPDLDVGALASAEKVMGRDGLTRLSRLQLAGDRAVKGLLSGGITTYGELEEYLGRQTNVPSAMLEAVAARKQQGDKKISASELKGIAKRIQAGVSGEDTQAILAKFSGKGLSSAAMVAAARAFGGLDPEGQFEGDFTARNLLTFGMQSTRFQSRTMDARAKGLLLTSHLEMLGGDDIGRSFAALQKMYEGEFDFSSKGLGRYTANINADVLMGIADEQDPERAMSLARSALNQAGLGDDPARLLVAARQLRKFDSGHLLKGSKRISHEDLLTAARASKIGQAKELLMSPFLREAGENAWSQLSLESGASATMLGKLSRIRSELLGGHGDFSVLSDKLSKDPAIRKRLDDILGEGETGEGRGKSKQLFDRYFSQYEEAKKGLQESELKGGSSNPLAALDIKGVISAITSLTSAVNSAVKTP